MMRKRETERKKYRDCLGLFQRADEAEEGCAGENASSPPADLTAFCFEIE